jgi:hypothetical protein
MTVATPTDPAAKAHVFDALDEIRKAIAEALAGDRRYTLAEVDDDLASLIAAHQIAEHTDPHVYDWDTAGDFAPLGVTTEELADLSVLADRLAG